MSVAVPVLHALVAAYVVSLLLVVVGLLRSRRRTARSAAADWPDVDVVVPARDEAATLPRAIASLLAQDYPGRFTIWVVDDRSSDATPAIIHAATVRDARVRGVRVPAPSRRWAPKVNAVWHGLRAGGAPWIATTDADCVHPRGWLRSLMRHAAADVVMVIGHVETARAGAARGLLGRYEALDWTSLMLTARALSSFGWKLASSANNQAYSRAAFEAIGGFGIAARAPSGDEDLLVQRLGRLPGCRVAFSDEPDARVLTAPQPDWGAFLRQRRRWASRYQHIVQYSPAFLAAIAVLGLQSVALASALVLAPFVPGLAAAALAAWGAKLLVEVAGMHLGLAQLGRGDLMGWPVVAWAALHPFVIAAVVLWSLVRPGSWRSGARTYRRRLVLARWRRWRSWASRVLVAAPAPRPPTNGRRGRW